MAAGLEKKNDMDNSLDLEIKKYERYDKTAIFLIPLILLTIIIALTNINLYITLLTIICLLITLLCDNSKMN